MCTANFAGRGGVITRIAPHATGHTSARDGTLLRVDCERGIGWVVTHYDPSMRVIQQVRGSDADIHRVAACWEHPLAGLTPAEIDAATPVTD